RAGGAIPGDRRGLTRVTSRDDRPGVAAAWIGNEFLLHGGTTRRDPIGDIVRAARRTLLGDAEQGLRQRPALHRGREPVCWSAKTSRVGSRPRRTSSRGRAPSCSPSRLIAAHPCLYAAAIDSRSPKPP